jgi:hypothetical protein
VAVFLDSMGVSNRLAPPYASCVIVELHELHPKQFSVQIRYKNDSNHEAYNLTIPGKFLLSLCPRPRHLTPDMKSIQFLPDFCLLYPGLRGGGIMSICQCPHVDSVH